MTDLQLLEWNYYDGDGDVKVYGGCLSLRRVNFCLVVDGVMGISVVRDSSGQTNTHPPLYRESWVYCTSAWTNEKFADI